MMHKRIGIGSTGQYAALGFVMFGLLLVTQGCGDDDKKTNTPTPELTTFYLDADGDGFGDPDATFDAEEAPEGYVTNSDDCDDLMADANPDASEVCDEVDNDCDGVVDAGGCGDNSTCSDSDDNITCACNDGFEGSDGNCSILTWDAVSAGGRHVYNAKSESAHTCAIRGGQLYCWGSNSDSQLGNPAIVSSATPVRVGDATDWQDVAAGGGFTCGIRAKKLFCWGTNITRGKYDGTTIGILGLGTAYDMELVIEEPTQVGTESDWVSVVAGTNHACGIRENSSDERTVWCWGKSSDGNLGDGLDTSSNVPLQESTMATDWVMINAGYRSTTCGVRDDGTDKTLWCWGQGYGGVNGGDDPTQVGAEVDWSMMRSGSWEGCGIRDDGTDKTLWCVGSNRHGQVGINSDSSSTSTWTQVGTETDWTDIDKGSGTSCGIQGGDLYCWGRSHDNELGLGADLSTRTECDEDHNPGQWDCDEPALVDEDRTWVSVSVGNGHACGITSNDSLFCWGLNYAGQAGRPPATNPYVLTPAKIE